VTAFVEVMAAPGPPSLSGVAYRKSLAAFKRQEVRDEALQSPAGRLALSWAAQYPPVRRIEERALHALAVQSDLRAGRISLHKAELLAYGSDNGTVLSLDALSANSAATAQPVFSGTAVSPEATAGQAIDLLEQLIGPVVGLARPYLLPLWADAYQAPEWPKSFVRLDDEKSLSGLPDSRVKSAKAVWTRSVLAAPENQSDAARQLAIGTPTVRGWLVLLANRDPLPSITSREAGVWGRHAWRSNPSAAQNHSAEEKVRRHAQTHWRRRLAAGLAHDDPYLAIRHALRIAA
jgi:hypothetical protein